MKSKFYIPHVATIFFIATLITALFSWIGNAYGIGNIHSLLNPDGLRWELRSSLPNFINAPALGIVMILFIGVGLFFYSGVINAIHKLLFSTSTLTRKERRSLIFTLVSAIIYIFLIFLTTFTPFAIFKSVTGTLINSPFLSGIYYIISFGFGLTGIAYGYTSGKFRNDKDIIRGMTFLYVSCADYFITLFFIVQFFSSLIYSDLLQSIGISENGINIAFQIACYLPLFQIFTVLSKNIIRKK